MILPTRRLAIAVAASAPLWVIPGAFGLAAAEAALAVLVGLALSDFVRMPPADAVKIARAVPAAVGIGEEFEIEYQLTSAWPHDVVIRLSEALPEGLAEPAWQEFGAVVPAGGSMATRVRVTAARRSRYVMSLVATRMLAPLGFLQRLSRHSLESAVTVAPSLTIAGRYRMLALQHRLQLAGLHRMRQRGSGTAFSNLREYVRGDDPRLVDWKQTARRQKLITREFSIERGQTVLIAVDSGRMMTELAGDGSRFERALSAALALASVAVANGDKVGFMVFDENVRVMLPPTAGQKAVQAIRESVVNVAPAMIESDYALAFSRLTAQNRSRALIVMFSDVIDPRSSRSLIATATRGSARHLLLIVALRNDPLFAAARISSPDRADDVYRSAAAEEMVTARAEALERMRAGGAMVVDISPASMSPAVINRYLEIKARGAL